MIYITVPNLIERILYFCIGVILIYIYYIKLKELFKEKEKRNEKKKD